MRALPIQRMPDAQHFGIGIGGDGTHVIGVMGHLQQGMKPVCARQ